MDKGNRIFEKTWSKIKQAFIQECPPEIYACEICKEPECNNEKWISCQKRQKSAQYMESLDRMNPAEIECTFYRSSLLPEDK